MPPKAAREGSRGNSSKIPSKELVRNRS